MRSFNRVMSALSLAACLACALGVTARAQDDDEIFEDEIIPKNSAPVVGVAIQEDSWKQVVGRKNMGKLSVASHEILEVVYFDAPREFAKGIRRVKRGYYTKAIEDSFSPLLKPAKLKRFRKVEGKPWPQQYCLYYLGMSHMKRAEAAKGDPASARKFFGRLVKEVPNSRFVFEALMGIGEAWDIEGRYDEAQKAYKDAQGRFETMAKQSGISSELRWHILKFARKAELRQVMMLDAQKKWQLAKSAYDRLAMAARDYPDIQSLARVGAVRALVSDKVYDVAIRKCKEMIDLGEREGHTEYLGGAYLALADCYFERAGEDATPEDLVAARWNYLRVATLYFTDGTILPKARFRAGRCYERLAGVSKGSDGKKGADWARRQYKMVVERYPDSPWANEAKNRLAVLGKSG